MAPIVRTIISCHHKRLCRNASLNVSGRKGRDAKPASVPPIKINSALMIRAVKVCAKKRADPVTVASDMPTQGVISGASKMPKKSSACESSK